MLLLLSKFIKGLIRDELHDLAEESTNGVFACDTDESEEERKMKHDLVNDFIKKHKNRHG
ncbi:hypothetical protein [Virgibacillus sp. YIM 98842]|uniref:hypothetical protein n=1 Tax=Virgibacillus sp. YIM 98842 TaxID=2663533 RepID=UPI0013DCE33D|nr:hypothetical protein [Virgibacillus sp. YIM 98842]